jgi:hypothetical protein
MFGGKINYSLHVGTDQATSAAEDLGVLGYFS